MSENGDQQAHADRVALKHGEPSRADREADGAQGTGRATTDGVEGIRRDVELQHPEHWQLRRTHGVFPRLHATHARYHDPKLDASFTWTSRRHRKGRPVEVSQSCASPLPAWPQGHRGSPCAACACMRIRLTGRHPAGLNWGDACVKCALAGAREPRQAQSSAALPAPVGLRVGQHLLVRRATMMLWLLCMHARAA